AYTDTLLTGQPENESYEPHRQPRQGSERTLAEHHFHTVGDLVQDRRPVSFRDGDQERLVWRGGGCRLADDLHRRAVAMEHLFQVVFPGGRDPQHRTVGLLTEDVQGDAEAAHE